MATTTINDLRLSRALDYKAMSSIKGAGGAPWVFGAFRAFVPESERFAPIVNFFQTNNIFVADQLNVQFQTIDINNSAANAVISVVAGQDAINFKVGGCTCRQASNPARSGGRRLRARTPAWFARSTRMRASSSPSAASGPSPTAWAGMRWVSSRAAWPSGASPTCPRRRAWSSRRRCAGAPAERESAASLGGGAA